MKGDDGVVVDDIDIHLVTSTESPEFIHFKWAISHSSIIGLDAEWKPVRSHQPTFPPVLLLQIACQLINSSEQQQDNKHIVFLLDLSEITLPSIYDLLKDVFISPDILKLGFRFKQDLLYLSSTFRQHGCDAGFDTVEPYLDIANIYLLVLHQLQQHKQTRRKPKCNKSLSSICHELLGISLSKELQCSDWSLRPLTDQQKTYAALDALCLIQIFNVFLHRLLNEGFRFKQDLLYLSSTFRQHGCDAGFDTVEPYLDIANIYLLVLHQLQQHKQTRRKPKCNKSLSSICHELLGISLSKELQCSDWSLRPLTDQQKTYAALDALCLIQIFNVFLHRLLNEDTHQYIIGRETLISITLAVAALLCL
ncbi:3'-5' exonuclease domain-containing protein [Artemisia annua]|uniref:3'-5' exonuclease domain-containing protein n=1 Tax=Artemisia annua TaxID=35608 RepID=A0A2U1KTI0_ARTAN|nr:3'-5' exonuclease domain-containing protein [Artemisia annua]